MGLCNADSTSFPNPSLAGLRARTQMHVLYHLVRIDENATPLQNTPQGLSQSSRRTGFDRNWNSSIHCATCSFWKVSTRESVSIMARAAGTALRGRTGNLRHEFIPLLGEELAFRRQSIRTIVKSSRHDVSISQSALVQMIGPCGANRNFSMFSLPSRTFTLTPGGYLKVMCEAHIHK